MNPDVGIWIIAIGILLEILGITPRLKIIVGGTKVAGTVGAILIILGALIWAEVIGS